MYLLRKMGWNPGEGLGKNKEGTVEPLVLDIKMDKKGLTSSEEAPIKKPGPQIPTKVPKDLSGKHPVSAVVELCSKRRWPAPDFTLVHDSGPDHKKNFLFKIRVNSVDYQPTIASPNKKHAKAQAAIVCLQHLGLLPRNYVSPV